MYAQEVLGQRMEVWEEKDHLSDVESGLRDPKEYTSSASKKSYERL
jgi:hypothetical protein